jgi:hypothetical protein
MRKLSFKSNPGTKTFYLALISETMLFLWKCKMMRMSIDIINSSAAELAEMQDALAAVSA